MFLQTCSVETPRLLEKDSFNEGMYHILGKIVRHLYAKLDVLALKFIYRLPVSFELSREQREQPI
jgi:hypothetical protein